MDVRRRDVLTAGAAIGAAPWLPSMALAQAGPALAGDDRIRAAARAARKRVAWADGRFGGEGFDWLVEQGRVAAFFLLGEEHGIAENPKLAAQLFAALRPAGYDRVAVEISPPMAADIDERLARGDALRSIFATPGREVPFFGLREEAEWLAAARAAVGGREQVVWGLDYDIGGDRYLIARLAGFTMPPAARPALARLAAASAAAHAAYERTRDPSMLFAFAGDPVLVSDLRGAWPDPPPPAALILDTLGQTLEINRLWSDGQDWASNQRRVANLRANFLRCWNGEGRPRKAFLKFGSNHMLRGMTAVGTFDLGSLVHELAASRGQRAFHLLVLPGAGSPLAVFDPSSWTYKAVTPGADRSNPLVRVTGEAWPDAATLFPTEPLRRFTVTRRDGADPELTRVVNGFDAILVLTGSTASTPL